MLANNIIKGNTLADEIYFNEYKFDGMKVNIKQYTMQKQELNTVVWDDWGDKYKSYMSIPVIGNQADEAVDLI